MKIEKEPTKIIAKKKIQAQPKIVPQNNQSQVGGNPQSTPNAEVLNKAKNSEPTKAAKSKPEPTKVIKPKSEPTKVVQPKSEKQPQTKAKPTPKIKKEKVKFAEKFKSSHASTIKRAKIQQAKFKNSANDAHKRRQIFQISFIITIVIMFVFVPIYPNQETIQNKHMYLTDSDIKVKHPLGNYFSPFQFLRYDLEVKNGSEYIKSSKVTYKLKEMKVHVQITEFKPLAKDSENNIYFYENGEVVKKSDINLYAPVIIGFDEKKLESLLTNLAKLDYDVITQIDTIEYAGNKEDPDLLKMGMDGDNTVYIDIGQIKDKLPYYNQIKQIIDEKAGGKPGTVHLNIGDYYEPK